MNLRHWTVRHAKPTAQFYRVAARWAPSLAPLVRWVGSQRFASWLLPVERAAKKTLFDCRMCGQCVLSSTGMACPMGCGKQMRNGPCGGVRPDGGCEVRPTQRCVWLEAGEGDARIQPGHTAGWLERLPPLDHRRAGRSTWVDVIAGAAARPGCG